MIKTQFQEFKKLCSKTGTTEESLARAEKLVLKQIFSRLIHWMKIRKSQFFANFVLMDYGFGAIFGCPGHDQRDFDFAKKYKLPIKTVVKPKDKKDDFVVTKEAYSGPGIIINSEFLNYLEAPELSVKKTIEILEKKELENQELIID